MTRRVPSLRNNAVTRGNKSPPPFPRPLPTCPVPTCASVGCVSCLRLHALPQKNLLLFFASSRAQYPTVAQPLTYHFNVDIGHIIIDVSLVRRRVSTRRRSCRPQRIDFRRNSSTRCRNALASTVSPNDPITTLLARRHLLRNGQHPQRAHRRGGGLCSPTREVIIIIIIIYFIIYLYSMLTPYPPPSLLILTSITGRLMIASRTTRRF